MNDILVIILGETLVIKCDVPKPRGPLTTCQPEEDLWMSGNLKPHHRVPFSGTHDLTKIGQSLLCTGNYTQNTDSCHIRVIRNQQYLYPKFPPTAVVKLLQYSGSRVEHMDGFSSYK